MRFRIIPPGDNLQNLCHRIKELSSCGRWKEVLSHYREIKSTGLRLEDHTIFSHILKSCLALSFGVGKSVHASLIKQGFQSFTSVGNSVVDYYAKYGSLGSALRTFDCLETKDSVSWNVILHGHLDRGAFMEGFDLFNEARAAGFEPNASSLVLMTQAYCNHRAFTGGQIFQGYLIKSGFWSLISVQNSLLSMYIDISMDYAENLFEEIYVKDVISWSVMIKGYVHIDESRLALVSFKQMVSVFGIEADGQTMVSVFKACANLGDIRIGKSTHGFLVRRGLNNDLFVGNTLVDFYCKYNDVDSAVIAFTEMADRNIVSWNSMLSGFVYNEKFPEASTLFASMGNSGVDCDEVTLVNLILICKAMGDLHNCKLIHSKVIQKGFESNELVMNSLIDAYAKCNNIDLSWKLFRRMKNPDIVTWSTMISGFSQCGMPDEALAIYRDMRLSLQNTNSITLLNLLEACALSAEIRRSKWAHGIAVRMGFASDVIVGTAVLDMYSKCGAIEASRKAFDQISAKNIISWSAMIAAYGLNGFPHKALSLLSEMEAHGLKPNPVTTLSVLSACCHGGLVVEGLSVFKEMVERNQDELNLEHYSCLVDLLARAGNLDDAVQMINSIPLGASAWGALLSSCRNYESREFIDGALSRVVEMEPDSSAGYLLASNSFAVGGSWGHASGMRGLMKERGVKVVAGYSLVHVNDKAYTFTAGDKYHPLSHLFYPVIKQLHSCMKMDTGAITHL